MNTNFGIFDALIVGCGVYLVVVALKAKKTGTIDPNAMLAKGMKENQIKDKDGYLKFMIWRLLVLGGATIFCGLLNLVNAFVAGPGWITLVVCLIFFGVLIFYGVSFKQAEKRFMK